MTPRRTSKMSFENQREDASGEFVCVAHGSPVCEGCAYERGKMEERERCAKIAEKAIDYRMVARAIREG